MTMLQVHIKLSDLAEAEMEILRDQLGLANTAEVIRASVALMSYLVKEVRAGNRIFVRSSCGCHEKEITMNFRPGCPT